jgi:hypothetical protein
MRAIRFVGVALGRAGYLSADTAISDALRMLELSFAFWSPLVVFIDRAQTLGTRNCGTPERPHLAEIVSEGALADRIG